MFNVCFHFNTCHFDFAVLTREPPPVVANDTFSPNKELYAYREAVQYMCKNDR